MEKTETDFYPHLEKEDVNMKKFFFITLFSLFFCGCAQTLSRQEVMQGYQGVTPEQRSITAQNYLEGYKVLEKWKFDRELKPRHSWNREERCKYEATYKESPVEPAIPVYTDPYPHAGLRFKLAAPGPESHYNWANREAALWRAMEIIKKGLRTKFPSAEMITEAYLFNQDLLNMYGFSETQRRILDTYFKF